MRPEDFAGKQVYVVGGSMGIGLAIARRVAALGADVTLFARREGPLREAERSVGEAATRPGQRVASRQMDVADRGQVAAVMAATVADLGPPDVVINNAGRACPHRFEDVTDAQFEETMRVNLHGCWYVVKAVLPYLRDRGGYIVNTSSMAGLVGVYGYTDYCASKFGLNGFSEALRSELKRYRITVSVLCPPDTDTPGFAAENQTKPVETKAISAAAKVMTAEAVAEALLQGMARRRLLIVPGWDGRVLLFVRRMFPRLLEWWMDRTIHAASDRR